MAEEQAPYEYYSDGEPKYESDSPSYTYDDESQPGPDKSPKAEATAKPKEQKQPAKAEVVNKPKSKAASPPARAVPISKPDEASVSMEDPFDVDDVVEAEASSSEEPSAFSTSDQDSPRKKRPAPQGVEKPRKRLFRGGTEETNMGPGEGSPVSEGIYGGITDESLRAGLGAVMRDFQLSAMRGCHLTRSRLQLFHDHRKFQELVEGSLVGLLDPIRNGLDICRVHGATKTEGVWILELNRVQKRGSKEPVIMETVQGFDGLEDTVPTPEDHREFLELLFDATDNKNWLPNISQRMKVLSTFFPMALDYQENVCRAIEERVELLQNFDWTEADVEAGLKEKFAGKNIWKKSGEINQEALKVAPASSLRTELDKMARRIAELKTKEAMLEDLRKEAPAVGAMWEKLLTELQHEKGIQDKINAEISRRHRASRETAQTPAVIQSDIPGKKRHTARSIALLAPNLPLPDLYKATNHRNLVALWGDALNLTAEMYAIIGQAPASQSGPPSLRAVGLVIRDFDGH